MEFAFESNSNYKEKLGRKTWDFLHEMSNGYPDEFSPLYESKIGEFLDLLAEVYPCAKCSSGLKKMLKKYKFNATGREGVQRYICKLHNMTNEKLGKPMQECRYFIDK